ncbi:MAG: pyridoxal phosphate-dependent decarboxylase family protein [Pseudomonadales bacterium]
MTASIPDISAPSQLEPEDWQAFREQAHGALDATLDHIQRRPEQPVWREIPDRIKKLNDTPPAAGTLLEDIIQEVRDDILPYTLGNTHPRFWGWVHGSGTASGVIAQMMTAAINANMAGRDHAPIYVEAQVIHWMQTLFGLPEGASGIMCTGTSSATLLGLAVARQRAVGSKVRRYGNSANPGLVAYCSQQAHVSVVKAIELLGLGSDALRSVPVSEDYSMDCTALEEMLSSDLQQGLKPFAVISTAGGVNTGAIDDLVNVSRVCRETGTWHHVDGAFGALAILSDHLKPQLEGIADADSIAFDFHKWMHVNYAAGCLLVRDGAIHRQTFETSAAYLQNETRGLAGGGPWPSEYGIDLSRGFAALSVWFQLKEMGTEKLGRAIYRNCLQAKWLGACVTQSTDLELLAPVALNIVCYRFCHSALSPSEHNELNRRIVVELQCRGIAAPSSTSLQRVAAIRVCVTNHRTRKADLEELLKATRQIAAELLAVEYGKEIETAG